LLQEKLAFDLTVVIATSGCDASDNVDHALLAAADTDGVKVVDVDIQTEQVKLLSILCNKQVKFTEHISNLI
jgi:uncharacterized protein YbaP (TraB family)